MRGLWEVLRMKIAYIGVRGVPATYSGIEVAVEEIGSRIADRGHDVTVYCMGHRYKQKSQTYRGMRLKYVPTSLHKNLEMIVYAFLSTIHALGHHYDIYHFHAIGPATMSLLPRLLGKKVVATVHALDWRREKWSFPARTYLRLGELASIKLAQGTIVVSKELEKYFREKYDEDSIYIPNGVFAKQCLDKSDILSKLALCDKEYIIFVGRLTRDKRVHVLIQGFRRSNTDMKLCIVGGENDVTIDELKTYAGSDPRIVFAGPIYGDDLVRLFRSAYLFVLPSILEGLPVALMEAMAYGTAVLVSDIPENLELITHDGALYGRAFRAADVSSLAQTLQDMIDDPSMVEQLASKASALVRQRYDWDQIAKETLSVYTQIVHGPARHLDQSISGVDRP